MKNVLFLILGLFMFAGQIIGIVIMLGGWSNCPKRVRICIGILQCFMLLGVIGLISE